MKRLDKFILESFVGPFFMILLIVIFILMMQFLWVYIDELVGKGLGFGVILEFMFWGGCTVLPLAMPLATLLSSMMTMGQLGENNELMAMKAAGISTFRVMTPILLSSVVISIAAFFVANNLVPFSYNKIYTLRDDIGKTKEEIKIPSGAFYDGIEGYVLRVQARNEKTGMMYGVMVYDHTTSKGNVQVTLADSAVMKLSSNKDYLTFRLFDGINYQETNTKKGRDTTRQLQKVSFGKQVLIIPLSNYSFEKSDETRFGDQVTTMAVDKLAEKRLGLRQSIDSLKRDVFKTALTGSFEHKDQLDSTNRRDVEGRPSFNYPEKLSFKERSDEERAYTDAGTASGHFQSVIENYSRDAYQYTYILRRADVEYFSKYAKALACFILFFIGAPIGALIMKGGLGVSAIVSILFFVLYWVVDITGAKLARDGAISGLLGAFVSTLVLFPIGLFLTWKATHDSKMFATEGGTMWRMIKSKVKTLFRRTRIVFMGTPEFAVAPLDALLTNKYKVVGVVTVPDKASGRGLKINESPVKKYALEHGLPVLQPESLKDKDFHDALAALKADLFVVVGFRMLPQDIWSMPPLGTFNLHTSLLPQYRGAAPVNWAVINGEKRTGVTTFMIDKSIDTGGIILRQDCLISDTDTAGDVHDALMPLGAELVLQTVEGLIQKNVETRIQRSFIQGSEVLHPAPKLTRELCHIDWNDTTRHVYNLVRGLSPIPTAFTELVRKDSSEAPVQLKVFFGEKVEKEAFGKMKERCSVADAAPGDILSDGKTFLAVATSDGALSLTDIQLAGKKRMDVRSFLAGFRDPMSYRAANGTSKVEIAKTTS
ncbi:MAG: methionyl-tRNA formyltransferase [Bacteroidales bacterium]|nr:methionyl-tRNA formyltransferase [Bacteroidales bacterium]